MSLKKNYAGAPSVHFLLVLSASGQQGVLKLREIVLHLKCQRVHPSNTQVCSWSVLGQRSEPPPSAHLVWVKASTSVPHEYIYFKTIVRWWDLAPDCMSVEDLDSMTQWHSASFSPCSFVVLTKRDNLRASEPHICVQHCAIKQVRFFKKLYLFSEGSQPRASGLRALLKGTSVVIMREG